MQMYAVDVEHVIITLGEIWSIGNLISLYGSNVYTHIRTHTHTRAHAQIRTHTHILLLFPSSVLDFVYNSLV